jgi:hypothetical protein
MLIIQPTPLPCGCKVTSLPDFDCADEYLFNKPPTIVFCKTHAVAPDMLAVCRSIALIRSGIDISKSQLREFLDTAKRMASAVVNNVDQPR